jgi:hypothetical protein
MRMADVYLGRQYGFLTFTPDFKPGDPPPTGYCDWHAWAEVQHKAGLRQVQCADCGKWNYPQELSAVVREEVVYKTKRDAKAGVNGTVVKRAVCLKCANV